MPDLAAPDLLNACALAAAALAAGMALMAMLQIAAAARGVPGRGSLLLMLAASGLVALGDAALHAGASGLAHALEPLASAALFVIGPAAWGYAHAVARGEQGAGLPSARHWVPAAGVLVLLLLGAVGSAPQPAPRWRPADEIWSLLPAALHLGAYAVPLLRFVADLRKQLEATYSDLTARQLRWLAVLLGLYAAVLATWVLTWTWPVAASNTATNLLMAAAVAWAAVFGLRQRPLALEPQPAEQAAPEPGPRYEKARLAPDKAEEIGGRLDALMRTDKPYLESDLTVGELARRLDVSAHQLSQYLSVHRQASFHDYVNGWRVEAVKAVLARPQSRGRTLLEIALEGGFGSKSAFNAAFKRHTGLSPTQYRDGLPATAARPSS